MSMTDAPVTLSISYHAWNADCSQIALSPNSHQIWIYQTNNALTDTSKWTRKHVLDEHGGQVSGIDWCPVTNLIVTCGHDRNAYVWRYDSPTSIWKPTLVILRINRAATSVKWSPLGNKFAVGSGAKCVPICHFEEKNDWWVSRMIKKHKSSILSLAWCPNNKFIVTGSSDMKCRIFSAFMENIDTAEDDGFGSVFGVEKQHEFGEVLYEFDQARAWVHSVAWSPHGFRIAFASHASTIHFVQLLAEAQPIVQTIYSTEAPATDLQFLSDNSVIASGFSMNTDLYIVTGGNDAEPVWSFDSKIDKGRAGAGSALSSSGSGANASGGFSAARGLFSATVDKGASFGAASAAGSSGAAASLDAPTRHKNIISNVQLVTSGPNANTGVTQKFSSAGIDGRIIVWDLASFKLK